MEYVPIKSTNKDYQKPLADFLNQSSVLNEVIANTANSTDELTLGQNYKVTADGNTTLTFTGADASKYQETKILLDYGFGSLTLTGVTWVGGSTPSTSATSEVRVFAYGTDLYATFTQLAAVAQS